MQPLLRSRKSSAENSYISLRISRRNTYFESSLPRRIGNKCVLLEIDVATLYVHLYAFSVWLTDIRLLSLGGQFVS